MAKLIDDILAFSRVGRKDMAFEQVDMKELVDAVVAELASSWEGRELKWELGALSPVRGDAAMLHQVWINLLSNAIKFTRSKIGASISIGEHIEGNEVVYHVKDNGVGFDMHYADKLFGVFQRLHSFEEFEGTGIGLAIVKRIVTRHGGRAWRLCRCVLCLGWAAARVCGQLLRRNMSM
jgi:light-regulated signal transduction histidine kinase (bacteriophytochrome)